MITMRSYEHYRRFHGVSAAFKGNFQRVLGGFQRRCADVFGGFLGSQVRYMGYEGILGDFRTQKAAEVFWKHYRRVPGGFSDEVHGVRGCLRGILMAF